MEIATLGIDLDKNVCSLVGLRECGKVTLRRRIKRQGLPAFVERLPPCIVAMEACCGAHHLGRIFAERGHEVRLMSLRNLVERNTLLGCWAKSLLARAHKNIVVVALAGPY
jgi:transposase